MAKAKQTVITEQEVPIPADAAPNVVAYRVGQLEVVVDKGFKALHEKLDELRDGFINHEQFDEAQKQNAQARAEIERRVYRLERWNDWLARLVIGAVVLAIIALVINTKIGG
jgi:hypothetical protein